MKRCSLAIAMLGLLAACSDQAAPTAPVLALLEGAPATTASVETLDATELAGMIANGEVVLIDVRSPEEFGTGRIPGGLNAPVDTFDPATIPLEAGRETILYCRSARRSERAAQMLAEYTGGRVRHLAGGIIAWEESGGGLVGVPASE